MVARAKKIGLASLAVGAALALAGCGVCVVDNAGGVGSCGADPATVVTSQESAGENLSITYTGPDTAGLLLVPGFYFEDSYLTQYFNTPIASFAWGDSNDRDVIRLDPTDPGWTVTGSGAATTYTFSGTATALLIELEEASDKPKNFTFPSLTKSAIAPTISSTGIDWSTLCE